MREFVGRARTVIIDRKRRHVFARQTIEKQYRPAGRPTTANPHWHVASPYGKAVHAYTVALRGFQRVCTEAEWKGKWEKECNAAEKRANACWMYTADLIEQTSLNLGV